MSKKDAQKKQFCEKHMYDFWGKGIHRLKYLTKRKRRIPGYKRIVIYAAGQMGQELFHYITYETCAKVVGWTDMDYRSLQKKGMPVVSLEEALAHEYDGVVIAIRDGHMCDIIKEMLISRGVNREKIMCGGLKE